MTSVVRITVADRPIMIVDVACAVAWPGVGRRPTPLDSTSVMVRFIKATSITAKHVRLAT